MALIPTTPPLPPRLPIPGSAATLPAWLGPVTAGGIGLGVFSAGLGVLRTIGQARRAGLTGAAFQAPVLRSSILGLTSALPGAGLLSFLGGLAKLAVGETLPAFIAGEVQAGTGRGLAQPIPATHPLANRPGQFVDVGGVVIRIPPGGIPHDPSPVTLPPVLQQLQRDFILNRARLVDPRTGAGIAPGVLAREMSPFRLAEVRAAEAAQRVRFAGIPSVFVRRRL